MDWLAPILSIVVVIVGGAITYFVTVQIEHQKREHELKKEVYFEALEAITQARRKWSNLNGDTKKAVRKQEIPRNEDLKDLEDLIDLVLLIQLKVDVCATNEIKLIFKNAVGAVTLSLDTSAEDIINNQLIPAMKNDLMGRRRHWWQFWRRG